MDVSSIQILLRCIQSPKERFSMGVALVRFVDDFHIGFKKGKSVYFSAGDKEKIRDILVSQGIDPSTSPDGWAGLSRAEALRLGNNEKFAKQPVKQSRVAIKALRPEHPLFLNGQSLYLPARTHINADYRNLGHMKGHDWIVAVENWECFNDIHVAADYLVFPGENPLIVWRGDKNDIRADDTLAFIRSLNQPVAAFVDYDPAGMSIAMSCPRLSKVVAPDIDKLRTWMKKGVEDRYLNQIAMYQRVLDAAGNAAIKDIWKIIKESGRSLPQEQFVRKDSQ